MKESDRLAVSAAGLAALGVRARTTGDGGMVIEGGTMSGGGGGQRGGPSHRDGVRDGGGRRLRCGYATAATWRLPFPGFRTLANSVGLDIEVVDAGG